jgi:hypothetical protein
MFMKESYRIAFLVLFITETLTYELFFTEKKNEMKLFILERVNMLFNLIVINQRSMIVYQAVL